MGQVYTRHVPPHTGRSERAAPVDVDAVVLGNRHLSADYNVLALDAPGIAARTRPGQFVMIKALARAGPAAAAAILRVRNPSQRRRPADGDFNLQQARGRRDVTALGARDRSAAPVPRSARPAVHAHRPAGGSLDGGRRCRPRPFSDARRSARRAQDADDALLRRADRRPSSTPSTSSKRWASGWCSQPRMEARGEGTGDRPAGRGAARAPARAAGQAVRVRPDTDDAQLRACSRPRTDARATCRSNR